MANRSYYIYILSNYFRSVLYIGITSNLVQRVWQHKQNAVDGFTKLYSVHDLVYYEEFLTPTDAIAREKQLKKFPRSVKDKIIRDANPKRIDLYSSIAA